MRIVLLCGDQSNQHALAAKVSENFDLVGIALEKRITKHKFTLPFIFSKMIDRLLFYKIASSWKTLMQYYKDNFSLSKEIATATFSSINSKEAIDFIKKLQPDLIMVSGTSLIKNEILDLKIQNGIINLHTGLSPYLKGAPNCTNWCIANGTFHLIGNTIMWIDKGIDSGNIITSDIVNFTGNESLNEIHIKVMEHAHDLYIKALYTIEHDRANCPSVKQSEIAKGELFLNKMWNFNAKFRFTKNLISGKFKKNILDPIYSSYIKELKLIKLPSGKNQI